MIASLIIAALIAIGIYIGSHRLSGLQVALVLGCGILGLALVIFPNAASYVANKVGVGRGTDLLVYFAILAGLFLFSHLYFRSKQQEQQIVTLSRSIALLTATRTEARERTNEIARAADRAEPAGADVIPK